MTSATKDAAEGVATKGDGVPSISRPFGLQVTISRPLGVDLAGVEGIPAPSVSGDVKLTFDAVTEVAAGIQKPGHLMLDITRPSHVTLDIPRPGGPIDISRPLHVTLDIQKPGHVGFTLAQPNQMAITIDQAQVGVTVG
jgi:hypothetical protein